MKRFNTQINKPTNQNSVEVLKLFSKQIKKRYCKTLGTSVINSPLSPFSLSDTLLRSFSSGIEPVTNRKQRQIMSFRKWRALDFATTNPCKKYIKPWYFQSWQITFFAVYFENKRNEWGNKMWLFFYGAKLLFICISSIQH